MLNVNGFGLFSFYGRRSTERGMGRLLWFAEGGGMALKGAHSDPDQGIKGAKPRLREPKVPRRKETATTARLGEIYLRRRNMMMKLKIFREALALLAAIPKRLLPRSVRKEASPISSAMRLERHTT